MPYWLGPLYSIYLFIFIHISALLGLSEHAFIDLPRKEALPISQGCWGKENDMGDTGRFVVPLVTVIQQMAVKGLEAELFFFSFARMRLKGLLWKCCGKVRGKSEPGRIS